MYYHIQNFICTHILQGFSYWAAGLCHRHCVTGMGAGHPPYKVISTAVNL